MAISDIAVSVRGLSKSYTIVHDQEKHSTLAETLLSRVKNPLNRPKKETFWALKDVSFEIKKGEVVGIIGRNGAGKSTLLKILSRITEPTAGQIDLYGRVGSLLEVGTGFHPELTGRENIFLNGAILGMKRGEIRKQFDAIVDFAGVEKFIDTPVKRYSSGMYVRLAFAVAAHLNPEILIIDEVLAVGDAEFQKKCLGKMGEVANEGRTVLFVSHDMDNISRLCHSAMLLQYGSIFESGSIHKVVETYRAGNQVFGPTADLTHRTDRTGNGHACFRTIKLIGPDGEPCTVFSFGKAITFEAILEVKGPVGPIAISIVLRSSDGTSVFDLSSANEEISWSPEIGLHRFSVSLPSLNLYPGFYYVELWAGDSRSIRLDSLMQAIRFQVVQTSDGRVRRTLRPADAIVYQSSQWQHEQVAV